MQRLPDTYTFQARIIPVAVVVIPALFLLGAGIISSIRLGIASGLVIAVASALAGQLGRDRGKKLEPALWEGWGGAPTLRRLRYRDAPARGAIDRLHRRIEDVLGDPLPTEDEERDDPVAADARYREATRRLITLTSDHARFPLVFAENINYGMRRNLLGLRPIGITAAATTAIVALILLLVTSGHADERVGRYAPGLGIALVALVFWMRVVSQRWVRVPAEDYAGRLMESVEVLTHRDS